MRQPKALPLLACAQMCKFFSHYGMRALLVLYLVEKLRFSDAEAFGINALFIGLVELGGIFGGILADRYLGLRRAFGLGALLLAAGYASLVAEKGLFFSLALIVLGSSLFTSNITALLGAAYEEEDPRRRKGFTLFYMVQNIGALISTAVCGIISEKYGFRAGFAFCATGMLCGCALLFAKRRLLAGLGNAPFNTKSRLLLAPAALLFGGIALVISLVISRERMMLPVLPWLTVGLFLFFAVKLLRDPDLPREKVCLLLIYLGALVLFFAAEDQICSSLMLFTERESGRTLFGWTIPSSMIMTLNPIVILVLGSILGSMFARFRIRLILPFILVASAFALLRYASVFGVIVMISLAELMIAPLIFSFASEVASKGKAGMVMGMIPIAFSLAVMLGGKMSKMVALDESGYGSGFGKVALLVLVGGIILELLRKGFSYEKRTVS
jgi:POT family proton-dependent oligopeptide transporter